MTSEPTHEVRNSLIDPVRSFRLLDDRLLWQEAGSQRERRYADITSVHLIAYPGYGGQPLQCTLTDRDGKKIKIRSHSYVSLGNFQDRTATYGPWIRALLANLEAKGHGVGFYYGSNIMRAVWSTLFWLSVLVLVGYMFALIGGAGRSVGTIAPMAFVAVFLPVSWLMIRQNRPGTFDPKSPPPQMLGM